MFVTEQDLPYVLAAIAVIIVLRLFLPLLRKRKTATGEDGRSGPFVVRGPTMGTSETGQQRLRDQRRGSRAGDKSGAKGP